MRPPDTSVIGGRLLKLGYKRYAEYLDSGHWAQMRSRYLIGRRCACGKLATQLHHLTYENLGAETQTDFEALCDRCHRGRHSKRPARRKQQPRRPSRGRSAVPPDTALERTLRRLEQL